jgi:hypothetical protein
VEARHPGLGPDAGRAARIELVDRGPVLLRGGITAVASPALPGTTATDLPTVLMLRDPSLFATTGSSEPAMLRWMATIQPGYREPWAAVGSALLARNVDWWSAEWANRAFLEPFIDPVTTIGPHARALLGIALGAKEAGERGLATDVVRLALGDGRLTASDLAEGLRAAAAVACDRPNRWGLALADIAATSDAHAAAVAEAIAGSCPTSASDRRPSWWRCFAPSMRSWPARASLPRRRLGRHWRPSRARAARPDASPARSWPEADARRPRSGASGHRVR